MAQNMYVYVAHKSETDINTEEISRVLVLVAGLKIVLAQLLEGTRKVTSIKEQERTARNNKEQVTSKENHRGAQFTGVPGYVQLVFSFFLCFCSFSLVVVFFCEFSFFELFFLYFSIDQ